MPTTTPPLVPTTTGTTLSAENTGKGKSGQTNRANNASSFDSYSNIKASSEGGDKRMLEVIFERLKYTIRAEWSEGQSVSKILDTFEDVTVEPPERLTAAQKEDDLLVAIWKEKVKQHVVKLDALERAKEKLFSTVWKLLSKVLRNKVSGQAGFSDRNAASDVVWLVRTVRALVTDFDSAMPEILSVSEALEKILCYRQSEKMENSDYVRNLLALVKVYEQYCGPYGVHSREEKRIDEYLNSVRDENGAALDNEAKCIRKEEAVRKFREKAIAMQIIRGSCKKRYSGLRKNLATDFGLKINKYPETIDDAVNALNVAEGQLPHHFRKLRNSNGFMFAQVGEGKLIPGTNGKTFDHISCHKCKNMGHYADKCPSRSSDDMEAKDDGQDP